MMSHHLLLILGSDQKARDLLAQVRQNRFPKIEAIGMLAVGDAGDGAGEDVLGTLSDLKSIVQTRSVGELIIAIPAAAQVGVDEILSELDGIPVNVWLFPDYFIRGDQTQVEPLVDQPGLQDPFPALNRRQRLVKRAFDLCVTCLLLPFSLVIMGLIAIAIRIEGPGPILFRQKRVGENGKLFELFKFRTMIPHAEAYRHLVEHYDEHGNLIHKSEHDPRVTRIGHYLRKTSLDELPQLFNVLQGDMSIVGPRPELPYLVERYEPWQRKRFSVPPGLTCWWQVNGRSNRPMHLHTEDDLYYVENYSFWFDMKILLMTVVVVLRGKGAY